MRRRLRSRYWEHLGWRRRRPPGPRHLARYGLAARAGLVLLFSVLVGMLRMHTVRRPWRYDARDVGRCRTQRAIKTTMSAVTRRCYMRWRLTSWRRRSRRRRPGWSRREQGHYWALSTEIAGRARRRSYPGTSLLAAGGVAVAIACARRRRGALLDAARCPAKEAAEEEKMTTNGVSFAIFCEFPRRITVLG